LPSTTSNSTLGECVPDNAMSDPDEILGGVCHLRRIEFGGRRPYHFHDPRHAASRRWEIWMDGDQARAVQAERRT